MRGRRVVLFIIVTAALAACAPALREPPAVAVLGSSAAWLPAVTPPPADVDRVIGEAEASFARRPDLPAVTRAVELFLAAARADDARIEGLLGAARASAWLIEHEPDVRRRAALATEAVQACQWCARRAPADLSCKYRLALALGQQARERRSTGMDALPRIVSLLEEVIAEDSRLDAAGGHRVLGLLLVRAPGWPTGPGTRAPG